jgi:hypothetical protein
VIPDDVTMQRNISNVTVTYVRWNHIVAVSAVKIANDVKSVVRQNTAALSQLFVELRQVAQDLQRQSRSVGLFEEVDYLALSKGFEYRQRVLERRSAIAKLSQMKCVRCPDFVKHVRRTRTCILLYTDIIFCMI